jgi:L-fucose isomerase
LWDIQAGGDITPFWAEYRSLFMKEQRIALVAISDERPAIHAPDQQHNLDVLKEMAEVLGKAEPRIKFSVHPTVVHNMDEAVAAGKRFRADDVHGALICHNMWTYARLAMMLARVYGGRIAGYTNQDPTRPALVGLLCTAGSIDKMGYYHPRFIGPVKNPEVRDGILHWARAAGTAGTLVGETYCNFGGRSMGMHTAVRDANDWILRYGVDVEQVDQLAVLEEAKRIPKEKADGAFQWLKKNVGFIDPKVPEEKIKNQIRLHEAVKKICRERFIDFYGIKCQPELSEGTDWAVPCLNQAFSNADFDWDGPKDPVVCACEADMGAAMTMRLLQGVSGTGATFMDFRDYSAEHDDYIFCNCGSHNVCCAPSMKDVHLVPTDKYYPSGGAHVQLINKAGEVTIARLCEDAEGEWMAVMLGEFVEHPWERMKETAPLWPHAYFKADVAPANLLDAYGSNHAHSVYGNWVEELRHLGRMLGFRTRVFNKTQ